MLLGEAGEAATAVARGGKVETGGSIFPSDGYEDGIEWKSGAVEKAAYLRVVMDTNRERSAIMKSGKFGGKVKVAVVFPIVFSIACLIALLAWSAGPASAAHNIPS